MVEEVYTLQFSSQSLCFLVIMDLSIVSSARSCEWNTNSKTKETENVTTCNQGCEIEKNQISSAVCLFTLSNDTRPGVQDWTEYSQGAFGCTSQHTSETASHYQRNSQPWQIIPYYFLKENIKSVSCVSVKFFLAAVHSYLSSSLFSLYCVLMTQLGPAE